VNGSGANVAGCATCRGRCCREYRVEINVADLRRLSRGTALHPSDFIQLREGQAGEKGFRLHKDGPPMGLNLVRRPETRGCVFLVEIAPDLARCGVYAHRPSVCRNFPTTVEHGAVDIRRDVTCGPDAWNLAAMDLCEYRRGFVRSRADWAEHWQIVETWNAAVGQGGRRRSPKELYDFLVGHPAHPNGSNRPNGSNGSS
jgi:Fe-S-cluster containining protein